MPTILFPQLLNQRNLAVRSALTFVTFYFSVFFCDFKYFCLEESSPPGKNELVWGGKKSQNVPKPRSFVVRHFCLLKKEKKFYCMSFSYKSNVRND